MKLNYLDDWENCALVIITHGILDNVKHGRTRSSPRNSRDRQTKQGTVDNLHVVLLTFSHVGIESHGHRCRFPAVPALRLQRCYHAVTSANINVSRIVFPNSAAVNNLEVEITEHAALRRAGQEGESYTSQPHPTAHAPSEPVLTSDGQNRRTVARQSGRGDLISQFWIWLLPPFSD